MSENKKLTSKRESLLIIAKFLYVLVALIVARNIYSQVEYLITFGNLYIDYVTFAIVTVISIALIVVLILQFSPVFLNKKGKIKANWMLLGTIIVYILYRLYGLVRFVISLINNEAIEFSIMNHIIFLIVEALITWAILMGYWFVVNKLKKIDADMESENE